MGKTHQQLTAALSPERRKRIAHRIDKMIAEERDRRDRRLLRLVTQHRVKQSGVGLHSSSPLEKGTDTLLSTLRDHVRKMGGELVVTVQFPGRERMRITAFADIARGAGGSRSSRRAASVGKRAAQRAHRTASGGKSQRKRGASHSR